MYGGFYGFREKPFSLLPDPDFLFPSRKHQMALNLLEMAIFNQSGFCVISGEIGTGKTTLVRELLNRLDDDVCVGLISNTDDSFTELLGWILSAFGIKAESEQSIHRHQQFTDFLSAQHAAGRHTLLIIDEAQNLSVSAMEQLRMLSNVNSNKDLVLQVILVGQQELRGKLQTPELAQFAQRISIDYHLAALDEQETAAYIRHRVARAGGPDDLFEDAACRRVYQYSKGVPRAINRICDLGLVYGFADEVRRIGAGLIEAVVRGQQLMTGGDASSNGMSDELAEPQTPLASAGIPKVSPRQVRNRLPAIRPDKNNNGVEQPGAKAMNKSPENQTPSNPVPPPTAALPSSEETDAPTLDALRAAAEKARAEKQQAEKLAAEKASAARSAIEAAAAERAAARTAVSEKLATEKLAAEKIIADRKAAKQIAGSKAAAESAVNERQAAEHAVVDLDEKAHQATEQVAAENLASDEMVFDKMSAEKTAMEEAAVATAAAEKALAERIAAEKAAAEVAAAMEESVRRALRERVAAEKAAAERVAVAERAAEQARAEQARARQIAAQKRVAEKEALGRAEADAAAAKQAAAARAEAKEAQLRMIAAAEQAAETANATRAAAEQAVAEHMAASKEAAAKTTAEKVALAKVAASVAAVAKQAAEQAEAAKVAALREANEREAAAIDAARKAAEAEAAAQEAVNTENGASAEIVEIPEPVGPENKPHPLDSLLLAGARQEASASRAGRKPGKTWAVMTIAAVAAGAAAMAGKWVDFGSPGEPRMAVRKPLAESTSVATMEVGKTAKSPEQQQ